MAATSAPTLWRWISGRILSLALGSVFVIATIMWLRYVLWNVWVQHMMPPAIRAEFEQLRVHPQMHRERYYHLLDTWYGISFTDPTVNVTDWLILLALVLLAVPLILALGLHAARPVTAQFSGLARAARAVTKGDFSARAVRVRHAPAELAELTDDFNAMTAQLERYEHELKASHVAMAHELLSPLTAAIGRLQGIMDGVFDADVRQLSMVMKQMEQLNRLIGDLRLLSLAQAGELKLDRSYIDLVGLLHERIAWTKPQSEPLGFRIEVSGDRHCPCLVDPRRIGQLFTILLENAMRYALEGRSLQITAHRIAGECVIDFRDFGPGVGDDFLPHIFQRFSREDRSRARHSGGSGLGLSIALAICDAHGGTLQACNHRDGGLCFTLKLPA